MTPALLQVRDLSLDAPGGRPLFRELRRLDLDASRGESVIRPPSTL